MIYRQCRFCAECKKNYPEDIALTIYPVSMKKCPRCTDANFTEIETDVVPVYHGSPIIIPKKPQRTMF